MAENRARGVGDDPHDGRSDPGGEGSDGGVVVVTLFDCGSLSKMIAIAIAHARLKRRLRGRARGLIDVKLSIDRNRRVLRSISLWECLDDVYGMGEFKEHVNAARIPGRFGIETRGGIFAYAGDWRRVLFGGTWVTKSPLSPTLKSDAEMITTQGE